MTCGVLTDSVVKGEREMPTTNIRKEHYRYAL
jgi:hypothetical protein